MRKRQCEQRAKRRMTKGSSFQGNDCREMGSAFEETQTWKHCAVGTSPVGKERLWLWHPSELTIVPILKTHTPKKDGKLGTALLVKVGLMSLRALAVSHSSWRRRHGWSLPMATQKSQCTSISLGNPNLPGSSLLSQCSDPAPTLTNNSDFQTISISKPASC